MTNQIQGEILFSGWEGNPASSQTWVYTTWQPVRGDFGTFGMQILQSNNLDLNWDVETRSLESASIVTVLSATQTSTGVGTYYASSTVAVKELYRYRVATESTANITDWVVFRPLPPSWKTER